MVTRKRPEDPRRQFYPLAKSMERTSERIRLMCQDPTYWQHKVNQRHVLPLDDAVWLRFQREDDVSLHIELTRHRKPRRDGLVYWWPVIEQWWQVLMEWQGPWRGVSIAQMRLESQLLNMKRRKVSYSKIAGWLNEQIREARQKEANIGKHQFSSLVATIPGLNEILQKYKLVSSAGQAIKYFIPKVTDDSGSITPDHVRERLRYLSKKSR